MPDSGAYFILSIKIFFNVLVAQQLTKKRKCQISELLLIQEYYWFTI